MKKNIKQQSKTHHIQLFVLFHYKCDVLVLQKKVWFCSFTVSRFHGLGKEGGGGMRGRENVSAIFLYHTRGDGNVYMWGWM